MSPGHKCRRREDLCVEKRVDVVPTGWVCLLRIAFERLLAGDFHVGAQEVSSPSEPPGMERRKLHNGF